MAIHRTAALADIAFPRDGVIIADRALPQAVLSRLDFPILVEAGEGLKTLASIEQMAESVLKRRSSRPLTLVAIGGGSVGDSVGFLARVLWGGVGLWHVPTSLLAMVDSAHGGQRALNLGMAKDQIGSLYGAEEIYLVDEILAAMPPTMREEGLAELIKALWLGDPGALSLLEADGGVGELARAPFESIEARLVELIDRAIAVKCALVARDPLGDEGLRAVLELGHTLAHAIELQCNMSHGHAVAWGLAAAAQVSTEHGGLSGDDARRLLGHAYPLLRHWRALIGFGQASQFASLLGRDKKRIDGHLRSVVLRGPGKPMISKAATEHDWFRALRLSVDAWQTSPVRACMARPRAIQPGLDASKSEFNRLQIIALLRPGKTRLVGESGSEDVATMRECTERLRASSATTRCDLDCGLGATTLRFLMAAAAQRPAVTRLYADHRLLERPHEPLIEALQRAGAGVRPFADTVGSGFEVEGWAVAPDALEVSAEHSSQYASALALLAASGQRFSLRLTTSSEHRAIASEPYFKMTLALLEHAGVAVRREGDLYYFGPRPELYGPTDLVVAPDASSAAFWAVASYLRPELAPIAAPLDRLQPDAAIGRYLAQMAAAHTRAPVILDLSDCPDLAPLLTIAALASTCEVHLVGAAHRAHESSCIEDFAGSLAAVGLDVNLIADGLRIAPGIQQPRRDGVWNTHDDHRLVMAGLLLTSQGVPLIIERPWVIAKIYPELWHHAREAGWVVEAINL
ncbi:MAG: hypothetical protein H0U74_15545 [Bradymonadaceae bacterium]|nr:hypothetical protein [Lujinxingiaceae bacterium]